LATKQPRYHLATNQAQAWQLTIVAILIEGAGRKALTRER
jgi:hypothetical protein